MHELRIAKDRCSVVLSLVGGETISGAMFVQHADEVATRRESARDVLNSAEPFFPIEAEPKILICPPTSTSVPASR